MRDNTNIDDNMHVHVLTTQGPRPSLEDCAWTNGDDRLIVADGMGGHYNGDLAATAVVELFSADAPPTLDTVKATAVEAVRDAAGRGSGTTLSAAVVDYAAGTLAYLHVGDSALWLISGEDITRLTKDQSMWGAIVASGTPPAEVSRYQKSMLLSCVYAACNPGDATPASWDEGVVQLPTSSPAYLVGTTDGFHEAFEGEDGAVDPAALRHALLALISMAQRGDKEGAYASWLSSAAEKTGDNATVVWMSLQ